MAPDEPGLNATLREHAPRVLATLVRRHGDFARCEDAVQEALLEAYLKWDAVPEHPFGWLLTVASRRLTDARRADASRTAREERVFREAVAVDAPEEDDTLALFFLCCHPSLAPSAQIPLTLRALGGLTTEEIAAALLTTPATVAQRIVRAKQRLRDVAFGVPPEPPIAGVAQVLYLIFNEGHMATAGAELRRDDLAAEAIRLTRELRRALPDDAEVAGLLALMLLHHARRAARATPGGDLIPLEEQDRGLWDPALIAEGITLVEFAVTARRPPGPYALQAAIVAVHAEAPDAGQTDWPQILALYDLLLAAHPNPVTALNRAVAVGEVQGATAGLAAVDAVAEDPRIGASHRVDAVRGHLLARAGETAAAAAAYERAAAAATQDAERRHLAA
ncbi:RNA polymerase sigma factor, partial [Solirubrobacter phytolaccae]